MRKFMVLALVGFLLLGLTALALAGSKNVQAKPFIFDPDDTGLVAAAWVTHQGLPDAGKSAHALMLQISPAEPPMVGTTPYQAGVVIRGVKGLTITELGFDIKNDSFSPAGLRFEVLTDGPTFSFLWSAGSPTQPDDPNWTRVRFDSTALSVIGSSVVQSVRIIFDEEGSVLLDNIDFNGAIMGKPGNARVPAQPKGKK